MTSLALQMVHHARAHGYAVGAFNMHSPETTQALVLAAERTDAPIFLQVGRAVIPHMGVRAAYEMTRRVTDQTDALFVIHLDHGTEAEVLEALQLGFTSVMYDGAHLPFEENIASTRRLTAIAHDFGAMVEAELGRIPDADEAVDWEAYYTDPAEAERFVAETGVDVLAISAGVVHGVPLGELVPLNIDRIEKIRAVVAVPLVLHGASGLSDREVSDATAAGVHKFNADTDLRFAFRRGIEETWAEGDRQLESAFARGRELMAEATAAKIAGFGCAGRAPQIRQPLPTPVRHW